MKGSRLYMLFLGLVLALVFLSEYMAPHKFSWKPTFDKNDKEPFGCYVFDDVVSSSIDDYSVINKTLYQIFQEDSTAAPRAFLIVEDGLHFGDIDADILFKLLKQGNQVMLCADNFPYLSDSLSFNVSHDKYYMSLDKYLRGNKERDIIFFGTDTLKPEYRYEVYPQMHNKYIIPGHSRSIAKKNETEAADSIETDEQTDSAESIDSSDGGYITEETEDYFTKFYPIKCDSMQILVWDTDNKPLALRVFLGKGELFLVTTHLMFTNFNMLDGDNASYVFRLLNYMKGKPLVRIEAYGSHYDKPDTPLRYILLTPSLRWALYSILALLLLFMIFTAKRRQRIIPVVATPPNRSLSFMYLISNLYFQRHDNGEILKMKYLYFCSEVKRLVGVDFQERVPDEYDYKRLADKTGIEMGIIYSLLQNIRMAIYRSEAEDERLKQFIDGMNDILNALKN